MGWNFNGYNIILSLNCIGLSKNKEIGYKGESIAVEYLVKAGYEIVSQNYRNTRYEIDIIALKDETLVFVEVKTRNSLNYGEPEESVDNRKINKILKCAHNYIVESGWVKEIRFDIITITLWPEPAINHIRDAFF